MRRVEPLAHAVGATPTVHHRTTNTRVESRRAEVTGTEGESIGPVAEFVGEQVAGDVIQEAINEVVGTSNRKWALVVVALVLGAVVASVVMRRRGERSTVPGEQQ